MDVPRNDAPVAENQRLLLRAKRQFRGSRGLFKGAERGERVLQHGQLEETNNLLI
jgi:hypothetical protein